MVGFVIATHGRLSEGLLNAIELIAGKQENIETVSLVHGDSVEDYRLRFDNAIKKVDSGAGVLVFLDFFGGTPSNIAINYYEDKNILCILGVNLPMLIEVLHMRSSMDVNELEDICINAGRSSIEKLSKKFGSVDNKFENDF